MARVRKDKAPKDRDLLDKAIASRWSARGWRRLLGIRCLPHRVLSRGRGRSRVAEVPRILTQGSRDISAALEQRARAAADGPRRLLRGQGVGERLE